MFDFKNTLKWNFRNIEQNPVWEKNSVQCQTKRDVRSILIVVFFQVFLGFQFENSRRLIIPSRFIHWERKKTTMKFKIIYFHLIKTILHITYPNRMIILINLLFMLILSIWVMELFNFHLPDVSRQCQCACGVCSKQGLLLNAWSNYFD